MANEVAKKDETPLTEYRVFGADASKVKEVMKENIGQGQISGFDLDRITCPTGGGLAFTVPSLEGPKSETEITGVIIAWKEPRAYWIQGFDESGGGTPPDCSSDDGIHGFGSPGGKGADCALSKFGSDEKSEGQACKQMRFLFMVRPNDMLPICVVAPPTSLAPMRKYFLRLASESLPYHSVVTTISLKQAQNKAGIKYAEMLPTMHTKLNDKQRAQVKDYAATWKPAIEAVRAIVSEEVKKQSMTSTKDVGGK